MENTIATHQNKAILYEFPSISDKGIQKKKK